MVFHDSALLGRHGSLYLATTHSAVNREHRLTTIASSLSMTYNAPHLYSDGTHYKPINKKDKQFMQMRSETFLLTLI